MAKKKEKEGEDAKSIHLLHPEIVVFSETPRETLLQSFQRVRYTPPELRNISTVGGGMPRSKSLHVGVGNEEFLNAIKELSAAGYTRKPNKRR
ncbi:MAG: hypothetical protein PHU42_02020 [Patescibacteria group bacterium]|nr:hypothetical protein [Patescibacteria group bacterium]